MMPDHDNTKPMPIHFYFTISTNEPMAKASSRSDYINSDNNNWNGMSIACFTSIKINLGEIVCLFKHTIHPWWQQ